MTSAPSKIAPDGGPAPRDGHDECLVVALLLGAPPSSTRAPDRRACVVGLLGATAWSLAVAEAVQRVFVASATWSALEQVNVLESP